MEYLLALVLILFGFVCGKTYSEYSIAKMLRNALEDRGIDVDAEIKKIQLEEQPEKIIIKKLVTERHNDMLYVYDYETKDFVCQGKTLDECAELAKKYKNIINAVVVHENKITLFVDGVTKKAIV